MKRRMLKVTAHLARYHRIHVDLRLVPEDVVRDNGRRQMQVRRVSARPPRLPPASCPGRSALPRRRQLTERLSASLTAILVMPQTLAGLERLLAARTAVRPGIGVRPLVSPNRRRVLEPFSTDTTLLSQLISMFEQYVLL